MAVEAAPGHEAGADPRKDATKAVAGAAAAAEAEAGLVPDLVQDQSHELLNRRSRKMAQKKLRTEMKGKKT